MITKNKTINNNTIFEIHNFKCIRCNNLIKHKDLKNTTATLSRNRKGIVFICSSCKNLNKGKKGRGNKNDRGNKNSTKCGGSIQIKSRRL